MRVGAIVLAAGEGRRLAPLTDAIPKPMLPILEVPLIDRIVQQVLELSPELVCVGLGYLGPVLEIHLRALKVPGLVMQTELKLSGPAGAMRQFVADVSGLDVLMVVSGDVLFEDSLRGLLDTHMNSGALLTFGATRIDCARRYGVLDIDATGRVLRTREKPDVPDGERHLISAGIYAVNPSVLATIPEDVTYDFASHLAPELLERGEHVQVHELSGYWSDIGEPSAYREAVLTAATGGIRGCVPNRLDVEQHIAKTAVVDPSAHLEGRVVIGDGARVGHDCWIAESVILPGMQVPPNTHLFGAIAGSGLR